ncbi:MAG: universal stress protein [Flavobacteriales bacterium]
MRTLLAAIDFSPVSDRVIELGAQLARLNSGKLWLLHVAAPEPDFVGFKTGPQSVRDHLAAELRKAHAELQEKTARLAADGLDAAALMVQGPAAETILHEAGRLGADAIVVGSHGHGALFRAIVGSVSEQVLADSRVPVIVVPSER